MNQATSGFVFPQSNVSSIRAAARWARRNSLRRRRDRASGEERKFLNSQLNWREFWHGKLVLKSYPRIVQVGTNWTCNLKCNFCRLTMPWTQKELKKKPGRELSISDRVEQILADLLPHAEMVTLTPLGEPLMWSGLNPLLERHARLGCNNLALTTNGMLLTNKNAEKLVRGGLTKLFISIDSNDPEIYAGMRVGGDLPTVEEGIRRINAWKEKLRVPRPALILNATFLERNIRQLPSMIGWAEELGFEDFSIQLMEIENPDQETEFLGHHVELAHNMLQQALENARHIRMHIWPSIALKNLLSAAADGREVGDHGYSSASPTMPEKEKRMGSTDVHGFNGTDVKLDAENLEPSVDTRGDTLIEKCSYPWYFLLIDTDGDVRPCCWAGTSWKNLNDVSFQEVWNGERSQTMRRNFLDNHIPESCRGKHCRVDL